MPNRRGATPQPYRLVRVVPVVQTHDLAGASLTVVSLEIYAETFLVHTHLRYTVEKQANEVAQEGEASPATWRRANLVSPEVLFEATDNLGASYGCWSGGGYGGGATPGEMLWRRDYVFAPALGAEARALRLVVSAIEWVSHDPAQPGPTVAATQPVGWTLTVPLSSAASAA
jgi:hypothetical protein